MNLIVVIIFAHTITIIMVFPWNIEFNLTLAIDWSTNKYTISSYVFL